MVKRIRILLSRVKKSLLRFICSHDWIEVQNPFHDDSKIRSCARCLKQQKQYVRAIGDVWVRL